MLYAYVSAINGVYKSVLKEIISPLLCHRGDTAKNKGLYSLTHCLHWWGRVEHPTTAPSLAGWSRHTAKCKIFPI